MIHDDRWWVLEYGRNYGPKVILTTNEDLGPSRRDGALEVIDRLDTLGECGTFSVSDALELESPSDTRAA